MGGQWFEEWDPRWTLTCRVCDLAQGSPDQPQLSVITLEGAEDFFYSLKRVKRSFCRHKENVFWLNQILIRLIIFFMFKNGFLGFDLFDTDRKVFEPATGKCQIIICSSRALKPSWQLAFPTLHHAINRPRHSPSLIKKKKKSIP